VNALRALDFPCSQVVYLVTFLNSGVIMRIGARGSCMCYGFTISPAFRVVFKLCSFFVCLSKNFFPLRVTEPWPRLPREAVESPSLEIFKTCLNVVLCSLLWVTLLGQGVGLGDSQRALPTPTILGFCFQEVARADRCVAAPFSSPCFQGK